MLECLTIRNFQCHRYLQIAFTDPIVSIVGRSDVGKTSIFRAIRWLSLNRPAGNEFISWGSTFTRVSLIVNGQTVVRKRGRSNSYSLGSKKFHAFGQDVPEEIASLLNAGEISFQSQFAGPWLFDRSPGEVARELNKIVDLELIDRTLANLGAGLRKARATVEIGQDRLLKARERLKALAWVPRAAKALDTVQNYNKVLLDITEKRARLWHLVDQGQMLKDRADRTAQASLEAASVLKIGREAAELGEQTNRLRDITLEYIRLRSKRNAFSIVTGKLLYL